VLIGTLSHPSIEYTHGLRGENKLIAPLCSNCCLLPLSENCISSFVKNDLLTFDNLINFEQANNCVQNCVLSIQHSIDILNHAFVKIWYR
jgi:hypothetical protein